MNGMIWMEWLELAVGWVPWAALAVIAVVTLVMIGRDRYRRTLRLVAPVEATEIDALAHDGKITGEEAQLLKRQCDALPEVEEEAPAPDLPLRLAAVISRIYATMMLLILFLLAVTFLIALLPPLSGTPGFEFHPKTVWAGWWIQTGVIGIWLLLLIISIGQFVASRRVLDGSWRARNWLVGAWLLSFLWTTSAFGLRYWAPVAGLFVLWVLVWRPGAAGKISARAPRIPALVQWLLPLIAVGLWIFSPPLLRFSFQVAVSRRAMESEVTAYSVDGVPSRLERLHILCGTPEPEVLNVAGKLAEQLQQAGFVVVTHESGCDPLTIDSDREEIFWIGRGETVMPEPVKPSIPWLNSPSDEPRLSSGAPAYLILNFGGQAPVVAWHGFRFPAFSNMFRIGIAIDEDRSPDAVEELTRNAMKMLLPGLEQYIGPESVPVPALPPFEALPEWRAPELRNFRLAARSLGSRGQVDVYAFSVGDCDADLEAIRTLMAQNGFEEEIRSDIRIIYRHRTDEATLYYWQVEDPGKRGQSSHRMTKAATALLVVNRSRPEEGDLDPEFAAHFFTVDPAAFLYSGGLAQLAPAEREAALEHFWAQPAVPRRLRLKVLNELMSSQLILSERERKMTEDAFFRVVAEIADGTKTPEFTREINRLLQLAQGEPWRDFYDRLLQSLGDRVVAVDLGVASGSDGMVRVEKNVSVADFHDSLMLLNFVFGDYNYAPKTMWFGLLPGAGTSSSLIFGDAWTSADPGKRLLATRVFEEEKLEMSDRNPPWRLWTCRWGEEPVGPFRLEYGGMLTTGRLEEASSSLALSFVFAPINPDEAAWLARVDALPKDDPGRFALAVVELTRDLAAFRNRFGYLPLALRLFSACPDAGVRRRIGAAFGESYCRIELPSEPDADGVCRGGIKLPIKAWNDVRVIAEIDATAAGGDFIIVPYGTGRESNGKFWRMWGPYGMIDLEEAQLTGERKVLTGEFQAWNPGFFNARMTERCLVGQQFGATIPELPNPGEYQLIATPDQANKLLEITAAYRPKAQ